MPVERRHPGARVDQEERRIGPGERRFGLPAHGGFECAGGRILEPGGIHHSELHAPQRRRALAAVAGHARTVVHNRLAPSDKSVEQRRFADIGPSDDSDNGVRHGGQR